MTFATFNPPFFVCNSSSKYQFGRIFLGTQYCLLCIEKCMEIGGTQIIPVSSFKYFPSYKPFSKLIE